MPTFAVGLLLWLTGSTSTLGQLAVADDIQAAITNSTNDTTVLLVRVDSSKVALPPQLQELASDRGGLAAVVGLMTSRIRTIQETMQGNTAYLAVDLPYSMRIHARMLAPSQLTVDHLKQLAAEVWPAEIGQPTGRGDWLLLPLGSDVASAAIATNPASVSPSQTAAWEAAINITADYPVQVVGVPPEYVRQTFAELNPELPPMLGGGASEVLLAGVRWLSLGVEPSKLTARLVVQSDSPQAAEALKQHIPTLVKGLLQEAELDQGSKAMMLALLGLLQPTVQGDQLILSFENPEQSEAVLEMVKAAAVPISRSSAAAQTSNNLKQMMLAIHNYESSYGCLPTYLELKRKQPASGLSWRVHILPYVDQLELYNKFKLDEPWDSPHNIQLLDQRPELYKPALGLNESSAVPATHTTYLAPVGDKTIFGRDKPIGFSNVTDGTSNTIAIVEVKPEHAIPWTSPEEYRYDPQDSAAKLRVINGKVSAATLDGASHAMPIAAPWNALFTIDGGEVVNW